MHVPELAKDVFSVGVKDWNRRLFDSLIPLPKGTSYNSYLIKGSQKTALIDTVNPGFEDELRSRIDSVSDISKVDYLIMNHAEPDHAGSIPFVMQHSKVVLVCTQKGSDAAQSYFKVPADRIMVVKDGDTLDLGGKSLKFIDAPWLHWPETMFTYLAEDKILFPCDFFGSHTSHGTFDDECPDLIIDAKRYFGEIMMPFRTMGAKAMEKLKSYDIRMIAPSHGPIYKNPSRVMDPYRDWTAGTTKKKAMIAYVSMWGSVESMVKIAADTLSSAGIEVSVHNLATTDLGEIAKDLVDSRAIVLGAPTVLGGMHPLGIYATHLVKALKAPAKYAIALSSYGWHGAAVKQAVEILGAGVEIVGAVEVQGRADEPQVALLADALANKIKG
jgi:flavorubredoxin